LGGVRVRVRVADKDRARGRDRVTDRGSVKRQG